MLALDEVHEHVVDRFEPDGPVGEHVRHGVGRGEDVGKRDHDEDAFLRAWHKLERRAQNGDAGPLGADERTRHIEPILGQQLIEILVSRHAARNFWKARPNEIGVSGAEVDKRLIDLAMTSTRGHDPVQFFVARAAD